MSSSKSLTPFSQFAPKRTGRQGASTVLRARITAQYRKPEAECLPDLIAAASLSVAEAAATAKQARQLVAALRAHPKKGGVEALIHEYSLSSEEGVALMCLAEALLRIPDRATRDALIRDKIGDGNWQAHIGHSPSLFVNAATWGLLITGRLTATASEGGASAALKRLIGRGGEPLIRKAVDLAMRLMGEQFVTGQTINEALSNSRRMEARGFRYSYDMLGEAAVTAADADAYFAAYEDAIHAIGLAASGTSVYDNPGISIKLSALHPRYQPSQYTRVMEELLPRLLTLIRHAQHYNIGLNIDAEEAERLDLSLDLLEAACFTPGFAGWNGIGFVVQAYQKRAPAVLDYLIDLGRRSGHRLMVRLVKGAYWDAEIKRAQVDGLEDFPVYTRKIHTDISYLACARKLLAAPDAVFPQFATHNAQTVAAILAMAGPGYQPTQYEFQCLHGMGEPLYNEVVGAGKLNRPCRIYAPVGTHDTLLAYLVRRLLENGANTSFVNRIADTAVPIEALIADPVELARAMLEPGSPHPKIALPRHLFGKERPNSSGFDLSNEDHLSDLSVQLAATNDEMSSLFPSVDGARAIRNPANRRDVVGWVRDATPDGINLALANAQLAAGDWSDVSPMDRAARLEHAANLLEERQALLLGLLIREAGKTVANAVGEVREAVDFLRYYAAEIWQYSNETHRPLGPVVCISPWNFPLAIFLGQVAASLAAGNVVLAKPAEETPLIGLLAVSLLHEAGIPPDVVQVLPGDGAVGAALVADKRVHGVLFTGSTEVARLIQKSLAKRVNPDGRPVPLIAETGGQNALIADSSALSEQVVGDAITSSFDSAGQRCSALRVLAVQEDAADRIVTMLKGAVSELSIGNPDRLATDIGPVITAQAAASIKAHISEMRDAGHAVWQVPLPPECNNGNFVPPTIIEIKAMDDLKAEIFGPVVHLLRFDRTALDKTVDAINATGYALTGGVHSRINETVARATGRLRAGNLYVNRNMIGAVVGVQPFGGSGLSGTGPKAGGKLYLRRLLSAAPQDTGIAGIGGANEPARLWLYWLKESGYQAATDRCTEMIRLSLAGRSTELLGPVGERNVYAFEPRGIVLCLSQTEPGLLAQISAALTTGNRVLLPSTTRLPIVAGLEDWITTSTEPLAGDYDAVLYEGNPKGLQQINRLVAARDGAIVPVFTAGSAELADGTAHYPLEFLVTERSISTNTAAAGGNASLMTIG
jgi:RHH-type proline utilization regulon transcriptional repressor/proline dehydrogenase/delta 1-pyrroline-5-carboxylate dehydrogenase